MGAVARIAVVIASWIAASAVPTSAQAAEGRAEPVVLKLIAPTYPAAQRFVAPERLPYRLSARTTSIKVLMAHPQAWAMVLKDVPVMALFAKAPAAQPFLANFTLYNVLEFGVTTQDAVDRVDRGLQTLAMSR